MNTFAVASVTSTSTMPLDDLPLEAIPIEIKDCHACHETHPTTHLSRCYWCASWSCDKCDCGCADFFIDELDRSETGLVPA